MAGRDHHRALKTEVVDRLNAGHAQMVLGTLQSGPLAGSAYAMDLALSSAFLNASTELMSGFAAPFFTARPIWARARVCVLPPTILASRTSLSTRDLVRIATSISSPAAIFFSMLPAVAYSIFSLFPEAASKAGASARSHSEDSQHCEDVRYRVMAWGWGSWHSKSAWF